MSWSKEDISFKKLSSKRVTWTTNKVFEEIGARSLDIHNTDIKADLIPDVPPGFGVTGLLQYYNYSGGTGLTLVKDLTVSDELTYFATIFNGAGNEAFANQLVGTGATGRLFNWVSDKYDQLGLSPSLGYEIKLYDKDGNQITKTDPSGWYFDYQTGILIFSTDNQSATTTKNKAPYYITAYRYVGGFGITAGAGGTGSGSVGTGYTTGIAYYTGLNDITSSDSFTWDSGSSLLTLNNSTFSLTGSTITSGDWAGNAITTLYGGTGLVSYTKGDVLVGLGGTLIVLPVGSNNYFLTADSTTYSGLNWVSGSATTGIISLNNLDGIAQTLVVGQSGVKFNISSTGTSHTFNIPNAGVGVSGLITGITQSIGGVKSFYDNLLVRDGKELRIYSDSNLYYSGLKSAATASTTFTFPNGTGTSGQVLATDGSGVLAWVDKGVSIGETPPLSPYVGDLWYDSTDGSLFIYYFDGADYYWVETFAGTGGDPAPGSGIGISSINGLLGTDQTLNVGLSGNTFNIVSAGSSHTFNLPYASEFVSGMASTVTQNFKGLKSFFDGVNLYNQSELKLYNADNSEYTGFISTATSSLTYSLPPTDGTNLQVLSTDGSGILSWISQASVAVTNVAPSAPSVGDLWWHSEEGQLKVYYTDQGAGTVNSQWVDASQRWGIGGSSGSGGAGITSLNGLDALEQTFSVGSSGSNFNISSTGSSHTFNIPLAGNGVTGLIDSGAQTIYGAKTFDSDLYAINNIYVSKDNYIGGVPADFAVGGSTGVVYFGIAKGQNINRFAGMMVEEATSPVGSGNLNGELVFYTDSETIDLSTERLRITGFGTVISKGPLVISNTTGSGTTSTGSLIVSGGAGIAGSVNIGGSLNVSGNLSVVQSTEQFLNYTSSIGSGTTINLAANTNGEILYVNTGTVSGNWTLNVTGLALTNSYAASIKIIIGQGATAYIPSTLKIVGTVQAINWQGGSEPSGNSNKKDVIVFSIFSTGTGTTDYLVLGQLVSFG
jgi:hypothetical protein